MQLYNDRANLAASYGTLAGYGPRPVFPAFIVDDGTYDTIVAAQAVWDSDTSSARDSVDAQIENVNASTLDCINNSSIQFNLWVKVQIAAVYYYVATDGSDCFITSTTPTTPFNVIDAANGN